MTSYVEVRNSPSLESCLRTPNSLGCWTCVGKQPFFSSYKLKVLVNSSNGIFKNDRESLNFDFLPYSKYNVFCLVDNTFSIFKFISNSSLMMKMPSNPRMLWKKICSSCLPFFHSNNFLIKSWIQFVPSGDKWSRFLHSHSKLKLG